MMDLLPSKGEGVGIHRQQGVSKRREGKMGRTVAAGFAAEGGDRETMTHTKNSFGMTKERMIIFYPDRISIETQGYSPLSWKSKIKSFIQRLRQSWQLPRP